MFVDPQNNINRINLLPPWPTPGSNSAFSAAGGAALLRLEPGSGYAAELAMFGGTRDAGACACDTPANDKVGPPEAGTGRVRVRGGSGGGRRSARHPVFN